MQKPWYILSRMESKKLITLFMIIGGTVGGYVPALWGAGLFSLSSIFFSAAGAIVGIWIAFKLTH